MEEFMVNTAVLSICVALHMMATALLIGQYLVFALVILPALQSRLELPARVKMVAGMIRQARPWVYVALAVFLITGCGMLFLNPFYTGYMEMSNAWSVLMLTKHTVVLGLIVLGAYLDQGVSRKLENAKTEDAGAALRLFRTVNGLLLLGGVAILSLTAVAQSL
jgi:uncharacterized membrane protein